MFSLNLGRIYSKHDCAGVFWFCRKIETHATKLHNTLAISIWISSHLPIICTCKDAFIVCCNAAALPMYQLLIYCRSMQHTAPQIKLNSLQYRNAVAVTETKIWPLQHTRNADARSRLWTHIMCAYVALEMVWNWWSNTAIYK